MHINTHWNYQVRLTARNLNTWTDYKTAVLWWSHVDKHQQKKAQRKREQALSRTSTPAREREAQLNIANIKPKNKKIKQTTSATSSSSSKAISWKRRAYSRVSRKESENAQRTVFVSDITRLLWLLFISIGLESISC